MDVLNNAIQLLREVLAWAGVFIVALLVIVTMSDRPISK